jgi:hypothetical protein
MFLSTASIDACLANRAQLELEEYNKALFGKTFESWLGISWVPLAHHGGMEDMIFACREFQKVGNKCASVRCKIMTDRAS